MSHYGIWRFKGFISHTQITHRKEFEAGKSLFLRAMEMPPHHSDWVLIVLLLCVGLILAARLYNPERFRIFFALPFHVKRTEMELAFNPVVARGLFDVSLSVMSYLVLSTGIYIWLQNGVGAGPDLSKPALFFRILIILVLFYLIKNLAGLLVGWVFDRTDDIARSQNAQLAHRAWMTIVLLPLVVLSVYNTSYPELWIWLTLSVILLGVALSLYFSFLQLWKIGASSYYKIFYLCTLEIAPLVFLAGWLKSLN